MKGIALVALASLTFAVGAAAAHDHASMATDPKDPALLIEARQGGMAMSVGALGAVSGGLDRKAPPKSYRLAAMGLSHFATSLPALFDKRTAKIAGTEASPKIWTDAAGFAVRVAQYRDATRGLLAAVDAGDEAAIATALASTKAACKACHDTYQAH